jgi:hypothetical protein
MFGLRGAVKDTVQMQRQPMSRQRQTVCVCRFF